MSCRTAWTISRSHQGTKGPAVIWGRCAHPLPAGRGPLMYIAFCLRVYKETRLLKSLPHCHCGFVRYPQACINNAWYLHQQCHHLHPPFFKPRINTIKQTATSTSSIQTKMDLDIGPGPLWIQRQFEAWSKITMICALRLC